LFSQKILSIIEDSAQEHANSASRLQPSTSVLSRIRELTGLHFKQIQLESAELRQELLQLLYRHLQSEREKKRKRRSLYNHQRHISLLQVIETIKKARRN
jgi:hypothetical protein